MSGQECDGETVSSFYSILVYLSGAFFCAFITRHFRWEPSQFSKGAWLFMAFYDGFLLAILGLRESKIQWQMIVTSVLLVVTALGEVLDSFAKSDGKTTITCNHKKCVDTEELNRRLVALENFNKEFRMEFLA